MDTTMKGLLKGLRYIAQIFEDEKEPEMQIGNPTDVKHVSHIGCDGPSEDMPSWMKGFNSESAESAPSSIDGEAKDNPQTQNASEESSKSSRRVASADDSLTAESPTKLRQSSSRRRHSTPGRVVQESAVESESHSQSEKQPDIQKKSRRKKTK